MKKTISIFILLLLLMITNWISVIRREELPRFDQWTRPFVDTVAETKVYTLFRWMTEFGSFHFVFPLTIIGIIVLWIVFRDYLPALIFGLGVLTTHLLNQLIKDFIARERPSISVLLNAEGYSFPSGHSMVTMVCYGLIAYFIGTKLASRKATMIIQIMFGCIIFLIGFSRYILNVHYLTDIISGFLFGFIMLLLFIYLYKIANQVRSRKQRRSLEGSS